MKNSLTCAILRIKRGDDFLAQAIRFFGVGIVNTLVGYALFALCIWFTVHPQWALLLATVAGTIFNFFTTGSITFRSENRDLVTFIIFVVAYAIIYVVNLVGLLTLIAAGFSPLVAQALIIPVVVSFSFGAGRLIFKRKSISARLGGPVSSQ